LVHGRIGKANQFFCAIFTVIGEVDDTDAGRYLYELIAIDNGAGDQF